MRCLVGLIVCIVRPDNYSIGPSLTQHVGWVRLRAGKGGHKVVEQEGELVGIGLASDLFCVMGTGGLRSSKQATSREDLGRLSSALRCSSVRFEDAS